MKIVKDIERIDMRATIESFVVWFIIGLPALLWWIMNTITLMCKAKSWADILVAYFMLSITIIIGFGLVLVFMTLWGGFHFAIVP